MHTFRDIPIRQKMLLVILSASGVAMLVAAAAVLIYEVTTFQPRVLRDLGAYAKLIHLTMHAPLNFDDPTVAAENLATLSTHSEISAASVYTSNFVLFAKYLRFPDSSFSFPIVPQQQEYRFQGNHLLLFQPIVYEDELLGYLFMQSDLPPLYARLPQYGIMLGVVLLALLAVSLLLSDGLKRIITRPIQQLTTTTEEISKKGNFAIRLQKSSEDEIGVLYDGFNNMLEHIQVRGYERDKAEKALQKSEEQYRTVTEAAQDAIFIIDREDNIEFVNSFGATLFGKTPIDVIGKPRSKYFSSDVSDEQYQSIQRVFKFGEPLLSESKTTFGKHKVWLSSQLVPLKSDNGEIYAVLGISRDITERKKVEEELHEYRQQLEKQVEERTAGLQAANKELEAFAYSVSHDLRAPLRAIDGFTRILMEDYVAKLDSEGKRLGSVIQHNAMKMGQLIENLLTFSRLGRSTMHLSNIDMKNMVNASYHEMTSPEERNRIRLTIADLPRAEGDTIMMRQVWMNLLSNAVKFSAKQEQADISVTSREEEDNFVYCVKDNGAGFDMKYKDKLFGVFQRLHSEKDFPGTGVGLAIVQRIVDRHGGQVWAEGKVDEGAAVYFSIPSKGK